jgi:hypothetical protein
MPSAVRRSPAADPFGVIRRLNAVILWLNEIRNCDVCCMLRLAGSVRSSEVNPGDLDRRTVSKFSRGLQYATPKMNVLLSFAPVVVCAGVASFLLGYETRSIFPLSDRSDQERVCYEGVPTPRTCISVKLLKRILRT